jgi:hypothetical protein
MTEELDVRAVCITLVGKIAFCDVMLSFMILSYIEIFWIVESESQMRSSISYGYLQLNI